MTTQTKYTELMKARAAAGMALEHGIEAMLSLIEESPAKQEMRKMLEEYRTATIAAREAYNAE